MKKLVPTLHCESPHPRFRFDESPFYPNTQLKNWEATEKIAAISSFGFGGTNCHMVIEKAVADHQFAKRKKLPVEVLSPTVFYWLGQTVGEQNPIPSKSHTHQLFTTNP